MRRGIPILFIFSLFAFKAFSWGSIPYPLRKLVQESKYIAVGYVAEIKSETFPLLDSATHSLNTYTIFGELTARIVILENIQGKINEDTIEIKFNHAIVCPQQDNYEAHTYVVAFLDMQAGHYQTHGLSYGAKKLTKTEIETYKLRIKEFQAILKIRNPDVQLVQTTEWLVKCAEMKATRWEGTSDLSPKDDNRPRQWHTHFKNYYAALSRGQKLRLKKALFRSREPNYDDIGLIEIVYKGNETKLVPYMV